MATVGQHNLSLLHPPFLEFLLLILNDCVIQQLELQRYKVCIILLLLKYAFYLNNLFFLNVQQLHHLLESLMGLNWSNVLFLPRPWSKFTPNYWLMQDRKLQAYAAGIIGRLWKMDSESQEIPNHLWNVSKPSFEEACIEKQRFAQNVPIFTPLGFNYLFPRRWCHKFWN